MAEVVLENVSKTFAGRVEAVRGVSLAVADGELVVLVGPSGCGKTTTLRMIAGLEQPSGGTVRIGDRVVNDLHPKDRDIAMVFQDYVLYPHMTVRRNLSFGLSMRKMPRAEIERRVAETAALLGLSDLLDRKPHALSGGQQQRVAVGRAIVRDPRCYLFDEPLSNLDAKLRLQMRAELKALHHRLGTTTIYVTHDQEEAMTLGDRLVVMHAGRIQQVGRPLDVYRHPVNRFVAEFLGSPPMNLVAGRLERDNGAVRFHDGHALSVPVPDAGELAEHVGRAVLLGVRPEHLRTDRGDGAATIEVPVKVGVVEPLGDRTDVYATTGGGVTVVARVEAGCPCRFGEKRTLYASADAVQLFEPGELGRRIGAGSH